MSGTVNERREGGGEGREGARAGCVGPCGEDLGFYYQGSGSPEGLWVEEGT